MKSIKPLMVILAVASIILTTCNKYAGILKNGTVDYDAIYFVNRARNS